MSLLITGGTLVTSAGEQRADLAVSEGRIAVIGADLSGIEAAEVIDARGKLILPGLIDGHLRPASLEAEAIAQTSQAAALGGYTTLMTFAPVEEGDPPADVIKRADRELAAGWGVDWAYHLELLTPECQWELPTVLRDGSVASVFVNLCPPLSAAAISDGDLLGVLRGVSGHGLAMIHCENGSVTHHLLRSMPIKRGEGAESHARAHPAWAEAEAIRRVAQLVGASGAQVLVDAVSSLEGLEALRWAKESFPGITAAVSPLHLTLGRDAIEQEEGHLWTVQPPLRPRQAHRPLWQALDDGLIDAVVSLHHPVPREVKAEAQDDPVKVVPGWAGIETVLPMLWSDGVEKRRLTPQGLVSVTSETPAKLFGLWPQKGSLDIGADADLVIFDPERIEDVSAAALHMGVDHHPMNGRSLKGWPVATVLRGKIIARGGEFVGDPSGGARLTPRFGLG